MGWFSKSEAPKKRKQKINKRKYAAGVIDRLSGDFKGSNLSANGELAGTLPIMRGRSRELCMNNDYARKFLAMTSANVVGTHGIKMQARSRREDGTLDRQDNIAIEAAFKEWSTIENCTVTGRQSWVDVQNMAIQSIARDGEVLILMARGFGNPFGFALQIIEADHLDENHNLTLPNGNNIVMGVELDKWGAAVAYHLHTSHPGETTSLFKGRNYNQIGCRLHLHHPRIDRRRVRCKSPSC